MDIFVTIALKVVRGYLNGSISGFNQQDMKQAIDENIDLWGVTPDGMKSKGSIFKNKFNNLFSEYKHHITTPLILEWISEDHPHLHAEILRNKKGYEWLDRQVVKIKNEIIGL